MSAALSVALSLVGGSVVVVGAVVRRVGRRDPLRADRDREQLRRAMARTGRVA